MPLDMATSTAFRAMLGARFWLLLAWILIDGAVTSYLVAYGISAPARLLLVGGIVAFAFGTVVNRRSVATSIAPV